MRTPTAGDRVRERLRAMACVLRRVIGVPDYDRYLAHERAHHPERTPLTREAFMCERLESRYAKPGARCC